MGQTPKSLTPRQNAQAMVSAAIAARKLGDLDLTEQMLAEALELDPKHADALQLMALLVKGKGDLARAEALMRQSLAQEEKQPHVHNNLGNLLRERGDLNEARQHYQRAVQLDPRYVEALVHLGETLTQLTLFAEAEPPLRKAHRLAPDALATNIALADFCTNAGKLDEAERLLRAGLDRSPDDIFYTNNLGLLLTIQQRFDEALPLLQRLIQTAPRQPEIFINVGNCLRSLGRMQEAANHYLKAVDLDPLNYHAHDNLNRLLWEMGRGQDVGKSFQFAKQIHPNHPELLEMSAECLILFERFDEAEADLALAAKLRPGAPGVFRLATALRLAQGRADEAIEIANQGLEADPTDIDLLRKLGEACLMADRPEQALAAARKLGLWQKINQHAAAYEATALRLLGRNEEAARLYDYQRFVYVKDLAPADGASDPVMFHRQLADKLDKYHHSQHEPVYQTLRNGTQTHESLFSRPGIDPMIQALGRQILAEAANFVDGLPFEPDHPFLGRRSGGMGWSGSWSVRLHEGGFHTDHIHPMGWISGVYYVETPDCLNDTENKPGWIKFGQYSRPRGASLNWEMVVRPRPGLLLLFPSYMWHGTMPISGDQPRLTIAFDIVPTA